MSTPQNQSVDTALLEAAKIDFDRHLNDGVVRPSFFHQRNEKWTGAAVNLNLQVFCPERFCVSPALNGRLRADHPYLLVLGYVQRLGRSGLDHADYRNF